MTKTFNRHAEAYKKADEADFHRMRKYASTWLPIGLRPTAQNAAKMEVWKSTNVRSKENATKIGQFEKDYQ